MKKILMYLVIYLSLVNVPIFSEQLTAGSLVKNIHGMAKKNRRATIAFRFQNEELIDIINMLAEHKKVNVILPTGANAITAKINLNIDALLTIQEAWTHLYTILEIAGYSLIKQKKDLYLITKNGKNSAHEPFPIYISIPFAKLPKSDERIRYVYYFKNMKVSQEYNNQITALFKELMPDDALLKTDTSSNGIIIVGKSQDIKSFMAIIEAVDEIGTLETFEPLRLRYTQAPNVANIFSDILKTVGPPTQPARYNIESKKELNANYFSNNIRVFPEVRTNSLIMLGKRQTIDKVKEFIFKYIDVELDSGKSILHVYELQYLDAKEFVPVLQNIVQSSRTGGTGQSKSSAEQGGVERFFDQVIIRSDAPEDASEEGREGKYFGGNKLIVAALNDDWKVIKALIEQLDQPQPQVIIEVLLAALTIDDIRSLGSISRNPNAIPLAGSASVQAAMIDQVVLDAPSNDPEAINALTSVASNLNAETVATSDSGTYTNIPNTLIAGTTAISISDKDGRTWNITEILHQFTHAEILSHPHTIAVNNEKATIEVGETRLVVDQAAPSTSGITRRKEPLKANTNVYITPRISSANTVNLQIIIEVSQFTDPTNITSGDRINRNISTNATVKSGDILALGGLIREEATDSIIRTPILSSIPFFGWLFKRKRKDIAKTSLTVFVSVTIVPPKLRGGIGEYTKSYVEVAKDYSRQTGLFDDLRDPITRWFFKSDAEAALIASDFLEKDASVEALHAAQAIDLIAEQEARILDENLGIAPIDTLTPLREFIESDDEEPESPYNFDSELIVIEEEDSLHQLLADQPNPLA